jgi:hypothetical protein
MVERDELESGKAPGLDVPPELRRLAVNELGAELDGNRAQRVVNGVNAAAEAMAGFEDRDVEAAPGERPCGSESGGAGADD